MKFEVRAETSADQSRTTIHTRLNARRWAWHTSPTRAAAFIALGVLALGLVFVYALQWLWT
jgi:hypothetical protein